MITKHATKASAIGLLSIFALSQASKAESAPNVIILFVDDMGYGDIAPFGSKINPTPNMAKMAKEGVQFNQFYLSSTNSTPSRAALMTGCYARTVGMDGDVVFPSDKRGLNPDETIMPEIFKSKGYATGCFGKWHLGDQYEVLPLQQGFDEFEGVPYSVDMWPYNKKKWPPLPYMKGNEVVACVSCGASQAIVTDAITKAALDFIQRNKNKPFFLYLPYTAVHLPRFAKADLCQSGTPASILQAQISEIDQSVGGILQALKDLGLDDNTLVFLTSDNGGAHGCSMGSLRGRKSGKAYEGRNRAPAILWYPPKVKGGQVSEQIFTSKDVLPSLARLIGANTKKCKAIDGIDQLDIMLNKKGAKPAIDENTPLFFEYDGIRLGDWKLVDARGKAKKPAQKPMYELYNLKEDIGEKKNIAAQHPQQVEKMAKLLEEFEAANTAAARPARFFKKPHSILPDSKGVPALFEYMGLEKPDYLPLQKTAKN